MALDVDRAFTGSVPQLYEQHMVPLLFLPYAADLARRVVAAQPRQVLELAAGTGAVTRQLASTLPASSGLLATDLSPAMLEEAARMGTARPVEWRQADAMQLPFADASFDAVACQFGVMFFPDKARAFAEVRRVLRPGGLFVFNTWGAIGRNDFAQAVTAALATVFAQDPPQFMARVPHGYHDPARVAQDLADAGFTAPPAIETLALASRAPSAGIAALALCQGTPVRAEIEARDPGGLAAATSAAAAELARRFGSGPIEGRMEALVVTQRAAPAATSP